MEITDVQVTIMNVGKLIAYANMTFDDCFVVRGIKIISRSQGYFVSMPSRRSRKGVFQDVAHPITNEMRLRIESQIMSAFQEQLAQYDSCNNVSGSNEYENLFD